MSSKRGLRRRQQRSGCKGKQPHATDQAARFHSSELYAAGRAKPGTLNTYLCKFCRRWHVGNRSGMKALAVIEGKGAA